MGVSLVRFCDAGDGSARWGVVGVGAGAGAGSLAKTEVRPLVARPATTAAVLEVLRRSPDPAALATEPPRPLAGLTLLSPVTAPCRVIAQAMNYADHAREVGAAEHGRPNILFCKASASIGGPHDEVARPAQVRLLDYEIELGLVIGAPIRGPLTITEADLHRYIGALVVANDLSARDVQVPEGQFYKGKSLPGFTPCGPLLFVPTPVELARWPELRLRLSVNGEPRQDATCAAMIHRPAATLTELSTFEHLDPGDLILTGTPGGVALAPPGGFVRALAGFLPEARRWRLFIDGQAKRPGYLRPGDEIRAAITTPDGAIDLGEQCFRIR